MNKSEYMSKYEAEDELRLKCITDVLNGIAARTPVSEWRRKMKIAAKFIENICNERMACLKPDELEKVKSRNSRRQILVYTKDEIKTLEMRLTGVGQSMKVEANAWAMLLMVIDQEVCRKCAQGDKVKRCEIRKLMHKCMAPVYQDHPAEGECEFHWDSMRSDVKIEYMEGEKMNKVILLGRLTKDPDVRYTQTGKVVAQITLAVDRPFKNEDGTREADFIPCIIWGKSAETLGNTVSKGNRLLVEGRMQTRTYDAKDGSKRYVTEVICDRFEYVDKKGEKTVAKVADDEFGSFGETIPF